MRGPSHLGAPLGARGEPGVGGGGGWGAIVILVGEKSLDPNMDTAWTEHCAERASFFEVPANSQNAYRSTNNFYIIVAA